MYPLYSTTQTCKCRRGGQACKVDKFTSVAYTHVTLVLLALSLSPLPFRRPFCCKGFSQTSGIGHVCIHRRLEATDPMPCFAEASRKHDLHGPRGFTLHILGRNGLLVALRYEHQETKYRICGNSTFGLVLLCFGGVAGFVVEGLYFQS